MGDSSGRKRRPTQADVARRAGVSQATVSQILNNSATITVPVETRQRVLAAVEELGYVPDRAAQMLRTGKTQTIACVIPDIANPVYPAFARGIQDVADHYGYDLILYNTDGAAEKERKVLRSVQQGRADGVIVVLFQLTARALLPLMDVGIAVVRLESVQKHGGPYPLDNLYFDNAAAARAAVTYLIGRGHQRIGMIAGSADTPPREGRVLGYRAALGEHGIAVDERLICTGDFREDGGYRAMGELLQLPERPTAVFAANDLMALGAMVALREAGLRVPQDVAVAGFDNIPAARMVTPALTTVAQFPYRLGRRAAELLFDRLGGMAPAGGRLEEMPFELIVRESA